MAEDRIHAMLNERWTELFPDRVPPIWPGKKEIQKQASATVERINNLRRRLREERAILDCLRRLASEFSVILEPINVDENDTAVSSLVSPAVTPTEASSNPEMVVRRSGSISSMASLCTIGGEERPRSGSKSRGMGLGRRLSLLRKAKPKLSDRRSDFNVVSPCESHTSVISSSPSLQDNQVEEDQPERLKQITWFDGEVVHRCSELDSSVKTGERSTLGLSKEQLTNVVDEKPKKRNRRSKDKKRKAAKKNMPSANNPSADLPNPKVCV